MSFFGNLLQGIEDKIDNVKTAASGLAADLVLGYGATPLFKDTSDAFMHYRMADGAENKIPKEKLRDYQTIRDAENKNQDRLLGSLAQQKKLYRRTKDNSKESVKFSDLHNNDIILLDDQFDVDHNKYDAVLNGNPDLGTSLGSFKLKSKSNLEFVKFGNKLLPYGNVEHSVNDIYDFNPGSPWHAIFSPLEKVGRAKSYTNKSSWKTQPMGVITIDGDNIDTSGIEWNILP